MDWMGIVLIVVLVVAGLFAGLYFLNRWAAKKSVESQSMIEKNKMAASIYVIDKKHDKAANVNLPKAITENLPKRNKLMKMYFVKAKIGPQIMTLMCDKNVFNVLKPKTTYKVDMAGIYIASVKGMKSEYELKQASKAKTEKVKQEAVDKKAAEKAAKKAVKK